MKRLLLTAALAMFALGSVAEAGDLFTEAGTTVWRDPTTGHSTTVTSYMFLVLIDAKIYVWDHDTGRYIAQDGDTWEYHDVEPTELSHHKTGSSPPNLLTRYA